MTEQKNAIIILALVGIIGMSILLLSIGEMQTIGQSLHHSTPSAASQKQQMITASGSFGGTRTGKASLSFPANGGTARGTFSGIYNIQDALIHYSGTLLGTYANNYVSGKLSGQTKINYQGRTHTAPLTGTFSGTVSTAQGTIIGTWDGDQLQGPFNLKFNPTKTGRTEQQTLRQQAGAGQTSTGGTLGYCRCRTDRPYVVGVGGDPYGTSEGLDFKGFMTLQSCINTCGATKYSWRER